MTSEDENTDELELLRQEGRRLGMPEAIDPSSAGVSLTTAEQILARAKATEHEHRAPVALDERKRPMRRTLLLAAAVAAAAAVIATLGLTPWRQDTAAAGTPPVLDYEFANARNIAYAPGEDAQLRLRSLAQIAESQPPARRSGNTQYVLTSNWFATLETTRAATLVPKQRATWLREDGTTRIRETSGRPLAPDGRGLRIDRVAADSKIANETYPSDGTDSRFVAKLGGNVTHVREALLDAGQCEARDVGPGRASCLYRQVTDLYGEYMIPAKTAAAFWRMLADEPSVRLLGAVRDRAGRPGVGISLLPSDAPTFRRVMIISPDTGQLLGTEDILIKDDPDVGVEAPAIYSFTAILDARYTRANGPTD
jgi:hypothetical protein